jgi:hypothetical protein
LEDSRECAIVLMRATGAPELSHMAIRKCPVCLTTAPMGTAVAYSDDFVCAGCGQHLEVSEASRVFASAAGIVAGYFAIHAAPPSYSTLGWAAPILYALLAYGGISALMLMFTADLRLIPASAPPAAAEPAAPHGSHH